MVNYKEFDFVSQSDHLQISALCTWPDVGVKAIIQLVHGMSEHKERYLDFMQALSKLGYLCVIHDHRGHGLSVKQEDDLGYFYEKSGMYAVEDIHQLNVAIKKDVPNVPLILFGHSMGSLLVRRYCKQYDKDIDGLIVCGSPSKNSMAKLALKMVQVMECIKGERYRSKLIHNLAFGAFAKGFDDQISENVWLCSDFEAVKDYDSDPLCGFVFTLNGFENLFHIMIDVYNEKNWNCTKKQLPILFIAGEEDPCIVSHEKFKEAYTFMQKVGYTDIEHHLFEGKRHEILNEKKKEEVYQMIFDWIHKKISESVSLHKEY